MIFYLMRCPESRKEIKAVFEPLPAVYVMVLGFDPVFRVLSRGHEVT